MRRLAPCRPAAARQRCLLAAVATIAIGVAAIGAAHPARAQEGELEFSIDPSEGVRGSVVAVRGSWLEAAGGDEFPGSMHWLATGATIGSIVLDPDGVISGSAVIPVDAAEGEGGVELCFPDPDGARCSQVTFTVLPPTLEANPRQPAPGEPVTMTGRGWCCPGESARVADDATGQPWGAGVVDAAGQLAADAEVPDGALEGEIVLIVSTRRTRQRVSLDVVVPVAPTTPPPTSAPPETTPPPSATTPPNGNTQPTITGQPAPEPSGAAPEETVSTGTSDRSPIIVGATLVPLAGLALGALLWRRAPRRRPRRLTEGRAVPRPDTGQQLVLEQDRPVVTIGAVLDVHRGTTTVHVRRPS